ncbi:phage head spike fiber domain-containing protein [Blastochloris tepida]|uniref:Uncharacterized protein n=1 Tax=Blastochloris tepida TaxID=2233851 RepID=A0A348G1U5_9HYPH|nr:hypothetical protein [Blastochloris tepida]BBF93528.1 hypothetical protein BLTE_22130 [Blastochloris tepida]
MLGTGLDLPTLARRRSAPWYRPDDVLRILPGTNRAMVRLGSGAVVEGTIETLIALGCLTYSRTGSAWAADRSGAVHIFASNQPRITDAGMTIEPAATNHIANSAMQGAVLGILGAGGALPAGWSTSGGTGLTKEIVEIATEDGIPCVTIRFYGTNADNYGTIVFGGIFGLLTATPYAASAFIKLVSGSLSVLTSRVLKLRYNLSPSGQTDINSAQLSITSGRLSSNRSSCAAVTAGTLTGTGQFMFVFNNGPGAAIDFTLKFGCPQVEVGTAATSPILTTGSAATRAADDFRCPTSGLSLPTSGTLVAEFVPGVPLDAIYAGEAYALGIDDAGSTRLALRAHGTARGPRLVVGDGEGVATAGPAAGVAAGNVCRAVATFSAAAADNRLSVNGIFAGASERRCVFDLPAAIGLGQVHNGGAGFMSGVAREWAIRSSVLTADDTNAESARYTA